MIRKAILTLGMLAVASAGYAQSKHPCATDEFYREQKALFPGIEAREAQLKADIDRYVSGQIRLANAKATHHDGTDVWPDDTAQFHIPVVVHVVTDYAAGSTFVSDNDIYGMIDRLNEYFNANNPGLPNGIIPPFRPYIGNANITFHLATKDPLGKPTRGITRHYSQHAAGGDELAKIGGWAPDQYLNIYVENFIGRAADQGQVLAYATFPTSYEDNPYSQGIITRADRVKDQSSTIAHEVGHFLSLYHPWNSNGIVGPDAGVCGDDEVDDTPPTEGHFTRGCRLYDTLCATGYMKFYDGETAYHMFKDSSAASKQKDYPDTVNTQNIMDYSNCATEMFTNGQVARMRATMRSAVGFRLNLASKLNLWKTGIWDTLNNVAISPSDVAPVAEFSVNRNFVCADGGTNVQFVNRSYNDTADVAWTFDKGAGTPSATANSLNNTFTEPGWVTVSLTASSNAGTNTLTRNDIVYAANPQAKNPDGYYQDFNPGGDLDQYPIFNYFKNNHKWEVVNNAGYYDKTSIRFANYETRTPDNSNTTQSPRGSYSDFYTPAFDLSGFGSGMCNLSFFSAGAFRTTRPSEMNDSLEISMSSNCGLTWDRVNVLRGGQIGNNGLRSEDFTPTWMGEWKEQSIPVVSRGNQIFFRFRFKPGVMNPGSAIYGNFPAWGFGTGNNFYLDRISITSSPLSVKNGVIVKLDMNVAPNPTSGAATVSLNGGDNSTAELTVTDVTGKLVYSSSVIRTSATTKVEIPAAAIAVKGMYLVKVVTNGATETQKLVVY